MSLPRRKRLVEVAAERELLVLEDNPYGLLRYEGEPLPTLRSLDGGEFVIYLGTFSKILSPGVRLGWAVGPRPVLEKMNVGKQGVDLCSSSMTQCFVAAYFDQGRWQDYLGVAERRSTGAGATSMLDALAELVPRRVDVDAPRGRALPVGDAARRTSTRPTCSRGRCRRTSRSCPAARRTSTAAAARRCG